MGTSGSPATSGADGGHPRGADSGPGAAERPIHNHPGPSGPAAPSRPPAVGGGAGSYLVDSASSHMLVSKIKPCMSKYKQTIRRNCEWLIKSVIVYLIVPYYLDNRGNSRANTC